MWVDEVVLEVRAGRGGNGAVSFRREKHVPFGGPDGGSGGNGASVWFVASSQKNTLAEYRYKPLYQAERGRNGEGSDKRGRNGKDIELIVPLGTVVLDAVTNQVVGDLTDESQRLLVGRGGRGGRGNSSFATSTNRAPRNSEDGSLGECRKLRLELRLLANVGLVGFPNAGKSTFISRVSAARPKIADYPFTTISPQLGVVEVGDQSSFVLADVPGLVPGASAGVGLGHRFLKHLSRTGCLLYFIDVSEASEREPAEDLRTLLNEVEAFGESMSQKPAAVSANKIDILQDDRRLLSLQDAAKRLKLPFFSVSAVTGKGCQDMVEVLYRQFVYSGVM